MYNAGLTAFLTEHPHVQAVWLDKSGNYYLGERANCEMHTREQVLGGEAAQAESEESAGATEIVEETASENAPVISSEETEESEQV